MIPCGEYRLFDAWDRRRLWIEWRVYRACVTCNETVEWWLRYAAAKKWERECSSICRLS